MNAAEWSSRYVFARRDLVPPGFGAEPSVLLEGSWPEGAVSGLRDALDNAVDARFEWVDEQASRWAERLGEPRGARNAAWINALGLRYYLAKLIRPVAYFTEVAPPGRGSHLRLVAARARDEDYADVLGQICERHAATLHVRWIEGPPAPPSAFPPNGLGRRALGWMNRLLEPRPGDLASQRRAVLCGNPRLLEPVGRELARRGWRLWWLYDRLAMKPWLRWRIAGVGQLVCDSSLGRVDRLAVRLPDRPACRGVDLTRPVERWLSERLRAHGPRQTRLIDRIESHFGRVRPDALIVDEDATPLSRVAVALARQAGAASFVVQHGAPGCRFGFAPPAADRLLVWGESSRRQLERWGVPPERIQVVGSPRHELRKWSAAAHRFGRDAPSRRPPQVLLLTTVPPRDDRPDSVAIHFTRAGYAAMLRAALAAVSAIFGARLIVKLHPRAPDDPIVRAALAEFPALDAQIVRDGTVEAWVSRTDCVLSCFSSAGIEATLAGVPVIQLLPPGSGNLLPHDEWGLVGSARSEAELQPLLTRALNRPDSRGPGPDRRVFAELGRAAAMRAADAIEVCDRSGGEEPTSLDRSCGRSVRLPADSVPALSRSA
jgi:hypothetical protein